MSMPSHFAWERHVHPSMSLIQTRAKRPIVNVISLLLLLSVVTVVLFAALRSPLKDDIAWLLYVAHRWMSGRELYVDLLEVNPPLIIWISALPLAVARWLGVTPQFVAMPAFAAIALASAWWSACLLRPVGGLFAWRIPVFAVVGSVLLIIPAADLGQREHLLVAAFLPYLILFARTLAPEPDGTRPMVVTVSVAGVLAALGCALKPQYGIVFVALEVVALCHRIRPWRAAPIAAAATLAGYVGLVAYLCPAYLRHAVPMALALYGATDVSFGALLFKCAPLLAAEGLAIFLWWRNRRTLSHAALLMTGMVFAVLSSLVCFIDGKDWFYHRLPATVVTLLVLILWAAATIRRRLEDWPPEVNRDRHLPWRGLAVAGIVVALFCVAAVRRLSPEVRQAVEPQATTVAPGGVNPITSCADLHRIFRVDRARFPGGEQYRRDVGVAIRLDVGAERRILAGAYRSGGDQGMADHTLGRAGLHRRLPGYCCGRYAGRVELHCRPECVRAIFRPCLVSLPANRRVRRTASLQAP